MGEELLNMKVILVDDDCLALEGISRMLHWERFSGKLSGCAASGREAIGLIGTGSSCRGICLSIVRIPA